MLCLLLAAVSLVQSDGVVVVESDAIVPGTNMNDAKAKATTSATPPRGLRRLENHRESNDDESNDDYPSESNDYTLSETLDYHFQSNDKWQPDKGDTTDCQSIIDRWKEHLEEYGDSTRMPPCRNGTIVYEDGVVVETVPPSFGFVAGSGVEGTDTGAIFDGVSADAEDGKLVKRRNAVSVGLAVALRPRSAPHPFIVTRIVTSLLNEAVDDIDFFVSQRRTLYEAKEQLRVQNPEELLDEPEGPLLDPEGPLLDPEGPLRAPDGPFFEPEEYGYEYDPEETTALYDMFYQSTTVRGGRRRPEQWWWRYDFVYLCFWKQSRLPVTNQTLIQSITNDLNTALERVISSGVVRLRIIDEAQEAVLDVSIFEEAVAEMSGDVNVEPTTAAAAPISANGTDVVQNSKGPTYPNPLDAQGWDYRRWLGLGLFCGTVVATLLLTQVASYRTRRRTAKEMWGNLGTEEGVDELLRTGWKVKGSNMEVYDKEKLGYTDDNSILMGGYEQKHEVVGAEITVTQSTTTPDTGNRS
jgi:hypothetical protein